jgi:hypothetical protein
MIVREARTREPRKENMINTLRRAITASLFLCCLTLTAQEMGSWRAADSSARSVTGDVILSDEKLTINFTNFTMVQVRALSKAEGSALFNADGNADGSGSLYRMDISSAKKFLHRNTLCGAENTEWMATYVSGRSLQLAFFSGQTPPVFTTDALSTSTDLCGTYAYVK